MSTDHTQPTPEQAREQLLTNETRSLRSTGDRKVHATGTAVLGLTVSVYMAARNVTSGTGSIVATLLFFAVWLGAMFWVERATSTVPRRTKLWSRLGISASFVVVLGAVVPWLNLQAQTEPNTWPMVLAGALAAAAPSLVAATLIARGRE